VDHSNRTDGAERDEACILCNAKSFRFLVRGFDRIQSRGEEFRYYRCEGCGLVGQRPAPTPDQLAEFYPEDYEPHAGARPLSRGKLINRLAISYFYAVDSVARPTLIRAVFRLLSGRIMRDLVEPHGQNRLLDIGCGGGELMAQHYELGWHVSGIEPNSRAAALGRSRGLEVHHGTVFDAPLDGREFDVILMSQVIEHLPDPVEALRRAARWLGAGGKIILTTPNASSLAFRYFGSRWFPLEAPRHLFLFDPDTIRLMATAAGLRRRHSKTRCEGWIVDFSIHYMQTQAALLPTDLVARAAMIRQSKLSRRRHQLGRKLIAPILSIGSFFGRGDLIKAELVAATAMGGSKYDVRDQT
jgi:SAM-dependent methyltransferase